MAAQVGSPIGSCPASCSSNCYLQNNFTCTNGQGVTLNSGADLDMNGHSITCTSGSCSNAAVTINSSGSKVYNTLNGFEAVITGPFATGVDCNNYTSSEVTGISVRGIGSSGLGYGVDSCAKVHDNVFSGTGNAAGYSGTAVFVYGGTADSDYVRDNFIDGWVFGIQLLDVVKNVSVDHNLITIRSVALTTPSGILLSNTTDSGVAIENNIVMGDATAGYPIAAPGGGPPSSVYEANYCDPTLGTACSNCISAGYCTDPVAPFVMP